MNVILAFFVTDDAAGNNLWLGLAQRRGANCEVLQKKTNPSISQRCQGPFAICRGNNLTWEVKVNILVSAILRSWNKQMTMFQQCSDLGTNKCQYFRSWNKQMTAMFKLICVRVRCKQSHQTWPLFCQHFANIWLIFCQYLVNILSIF